MGRDSKSFSRRYSVKESPSVTSIILIHRLEIWIQRSISLILAQLVPYCVNFFRMLLPFLQVCTFLQASHQPGCISDRAGYWMPGRCPVWLSGRLQAFQNMSKVETVLNHGFWLKSLRLVYRKRLDVWTGRRVLSIGLGSSTQVHSRRHTKKTSSMNCPNAHLHARFV